MENFIEKEGMDTQTKMVQLEDFMGKYDSFTQGASQIVSSGGDFARSLWKM
jgi:hypothetical protein